jgi:hypothetical protein
MSVAAEVWFFVAPPNREIAVLGRPSAIALAQLLSGPQGAQWKVRKNKSHTLLPLAEFLELVGSAPQVSLTHHFTDLDNQDELPSPEAGSTGISFELAEEDEGPETARPTQTQQQQHRPQLPVQNQNIKSEKTRTRAIKNEKTGLSIVKNNPAPRSKSNEHRRHERHELRLRVVVLSGTRSFRSFSKNISRGGLLLEHVVPTELVGEKCRVIVSSPDLKENIEFLARLAGDSENPRALCFEKGNEEFIKRLEAWISTHTRAA